MGLQPHFRSIIFTNISQEQKFSFSKIFTTKDVKSIKFSIKKILVIFKDEKTFNNDKNDVL